MKITFKDIYNKSTTFETNTDELEISSFKGEDKKGNKIMLLEFKTSDTECSNLKIFLETHL